MQLGPKRYFGTTLITDGTASETPSGTWSGTATWLGVGGLGSKPSNHKKAQKKAKTKEDRGYKVGRHVEV
jgi:hypothetical protein